MVGVDQLGRIYFNFSWENLTENTTIEILVGFASDEVSIKVGCNKVPNITIKCICHIIHPCASKATNILDYVKT